MARSLMPTVELKTTRITMIPTGGKTAAAHLGPRVGWGLPSARVLARASLHAGGGGGGGGRVFYFVLFLQENRDSTTFQARMAGEGEPLAVIKAYDTERRGTRRRRGTGGCRGWRMCRSCCGSG